MALSAGSYSLVLCFDSTYLAADYYTNSIPVTNGWKVQNVAKNKWFVLIAKSHEQKLLWVDAVKRVKENRKSKMK